MVDQNLLTVFIALTAAAVVIQAGILVGFYFLSLKWSRQADNAIDVSRKVLGPLQAAVENLHAITMRLVEFRAKVQTRIRRAI